MHFEVGPHVQEDVPCIPYDILFKTLLTLFKFSLTTNQVNPAESYIEEREGASFSWKKLVSEL